MKKVLSTLLAFVMLATTLMAVPFSAQAGRFPNTDLSIISLRADNGLPIGQSAKDPDAVFEVTCNDNNGAEWIVGNGPSTYWATSSGTKLTSSDTISQYSSYKLQLCVYPDVVNETEDEVDINEVKQITFNGVPLTTSQYRRGELGNSIYITVNFYYVGFTNTLDNKSGFYCTGQEIPVTANNIDGKHFVQWGGTYYTGSGSQSINFADATSKSTTFNVPYSSMPISVSPQYEDHTPAAIDPIPATCTKAGNTSGVKCSVCNEIITAPTAIAAKGHSYKTTTAKATTSKNGSVVTKCTVCGDVKSKSTIYYPKTISLSTTSYTYDGKVKKPSVKVVGSNGKAISSSNYTVSYASGRKYVGKYAVKVTFKGNYSGTKTLYFYIKPKTTSISSLTSGSKKFTVKWKKQSTQTTGYQIQYSTSSKFSKAKTVTVGKNSTVSKTISKLSGKKKYYVRVRTYKTVKINGKATKIYSSWSKVKAVTTKK